MSRATEIAEAEALAAGAKHPDDEPADEPAAPEEPAEEEIEEEETPPEPSSLAVIQGMDKLLEAESKRHAKAVAKALGDNFEDFGLCPLCQVDGYAMAYQPGEISPEQRAAILTVMGEGSPTYREHPTEVRCPDCDGWGEMTNGSRRAEQPTSACQKCMGSGHIDKAQLVSNVSPFPAQRETYPWENQPDPVVAPNVDRWGRPSNHPDFGLDPAGIVATVAAS